MGETNIVLSAMHKRQFNIFSLCHVAQFVWRCVFFAFNILHPVTPKTFSVIFMSFYWLHF
uniref:Uncharacterized protein n=1 Tax=Oryza rufipogon TaxID=4529 RepID=A0A0E0Q4D6_ORYRU